MNRRMFLKSLLGPAVIAPVVVAASPSLASLLFGKIASWYNQRKKEKILAAALNSPEGRVALAQAMVEPIRRQLEYQAIWRKVGMIDELPNAII